MASINIQDHFWEEVQALIEAVGDRDKAIGNLIRFMRFAQNRFKEGRVITENDFKEQNFLTELKLSFARPVEGGGYMVVGAEKHFGWLKKRIEAAQRGGKASGDAKKNTANTQTSKKQPSVEIIDESVKANRTKPKQTEPFGFVFEEENKNMGCPGKQPEFDFEFIYEEYPKRKGANEKAKGMERLKKIIKTTEDYDLVLNAIRGFKKHCVSEKWVNTALVKRFGNFFDHRGDWKEWATPESPKQQRLILSELPSEYPKHEEEARE